MISWWKPKYMIILVVLAVIVLLLTYDTSRGKIHKTIFSESLERELKSRKTQDSGLMDPGSPTARDDISAGIEKNTFGY